MKIKSYFSKNKILIGSLLFLIIYSVALVTFATPPGSPYTAGQTLDPACVPGSTNCTVTVGGSPGGANTNIQFNNSGSFGGSANLTWDNSDFIFAVSDGANNTFTFDGTNGTISGTAENSISFGGTGQSYTGISIDTSGQTVSINAGTNASPLAGTSLDIDWPSSTIVAHTAGSITLSLDKQNGLYEIGDIQGADNGNTFLIDDGNNNFSFDNTVHTSNLQLNNGFFATQDITNNVLRIGKDAGLSITSGPSNTFLGISSGRSATTADRATFVGFESGYTYNIATSAAAPVVFVGYRAGKLYQGVSGHGGDVYIGDQAGLNVSTGYENVFMGHAAGAAITTGTQNVAIGYGALQSGSTGTGSGNTVIGFDVARNSIGSNNTIIGWAGGYTGLVTGSSNIMIGVGVGGSTNNANTNILIGNSANSNGLDNTIGIGNAVTPTAANQFVVGSSTTAYTDYYFGNGVTTSLPSSFILNASGGSGTNIAGANISVAGGKATGNASGGSIIFQTSDVGASGSTLQSLSTKAIILSSGNFGVGDITPAALFTVGNGDLFKVNSSGAITSAAGITSSGTINFSGLSASLAVFTDGSKNLTSVGTLGIGQGGTGTNTSFTIGSVVFAGSSGVYTQDNSNFFFDDTNNRLGIGTSSPTARLQVASSGNDYLRIDPAGQYSSIGWVAGGAYAYYDDNTATSQISAGNSIDISSPLITFTGGQGLSFDRTSHVYKIGDAAGTNSFSVLTLDDDNRVLKFSQNEKDYFKIDAVNHLYKIGDIDAASSNTRIIIDDDNKTIALISPNNGGKAFEFTNADGTCNLDPGDVGGMSCPSDINLKKDIENLGSILNSIMELRPVTYRLRNEGEDVMVSTGLIAQEVQLILPKLVSSNIDGTLSLNYTGLIPFAIKAVQELDTKLEPLMSLDLNTTGSLANLIKQFIENATNNVTRIFTKTIQVQNGVEIKDKATGEIYCLTIVNGTTTTVLGNCDDNPVNNGGNNGGGDTGGTGDIPQDTTPPVITLVGDSEVTLSLGDIYTELGATAMDDTDGDVTANIIITNNIDTNTPGTYTVTYSISDSSGNWAELTREVVVIE